MKILLGKEAENSKVDLESYKKTKQFEIKAYYTPPFIVDYILSQTVTPFLESKREASCKVLDPACGSGIFLVETLRKIIEKEILIFAEHGDKITNQRLWELLRENIFGIDIDEDAIEITIFSLYITLLDYKTPIEIEDFQFERLKAVNLFGGSQFDFFNVDASFNALFTAEVALDFILGNPPWGIVAASKYEGYIKERNKTELSNLMILPQDRDEPLSRSKLNLELGNREISQAFLVRVSDFAINPDLKIGMVVTGKSLYNSDRTCKNWREYFLSKFVLTQVLELSCVNNKIVAGSQIFEEAKQAPAVLFFKIAKTKAEILKNVITHITVKPNRFFNYFRTIVIEKHDIKKILQTNFIRNAGGYDWLWKVMLHGNLLDFYFIKRLRSFTTMGDLMTKFQLDFKGGIKVTDGSKKNDTSHLNAYKFLDVEVNKEFQPYQILASANWEDTIQLMRKRFASRKPGSKGRNNINENGDVGYLPDSHFLRGERLLVKKGLQAAEDFKAVAAYTNEDIVFTSTVCAIKQISNSPSNNNVPLVLKSLAALINSQFFTYYVFNISSSAGIDRTRIDFEEIFSAPALVDQELADLVDRIQLMYNKVNAKDFHDYEYQVSKMRSSV